MRFWITFLLLMLVAPIVAFTSAPMTCSAQTQNTSPSGIAPTYALGEVVRINSSGHQITIRTKDGEIAALLDDKTGFLRIQPGEQTLKNAQQISLTEVEVGDVVMARGKVSDDKKSVTARQVVVMKKAEIAQKQQHSREEWRTRGIAGRVSAISQETKEVKLITSLTAGQPPVTLAITDKTVIRRYAPDSIEYSDSRPSSLQELKVGDQLRALCEKSADGLRFTPEVIISGSFRMVGGAVTAIDVATREITINDIPTKKTVKITINEKSMLRRVPAELVNALKQKSTPSNSAQPRPPADASKPADAKSSSGAGDMQDVFEQFPAITIGDIKPGIMILVASSVGEDPSRVTAIMLATGLDTLFNRPAGQPRPSQLVGPIGLPSGIFDSLIGMQ